MQTEAIKFYDSHIMVHCLEIHWNAEAYDLHLRDWLIAYWTGAR